MFTFRIVTFLKLHSVKNMPADIFRQAQIYMILNCLMSDRDHSLFFFLLGIKGGNRPSLHPIIWNTKKLITATAALI